MPPGPTPAPPAPARLPTPPLPPPATDPPNHSAVSRQDSSTSSEAGSVAMRERGHQRPAAVSRESSRDVQQDQDQDLDLEQVNS